LICTDNIYINPWRRGGAPNTYFAKSNDMKIDAFMYGFRGSIAGNRSPRSPTPTGCTTGLIATYSSYGGQTFDHSGSPGANDFDMFFDRYLADNISQLVPVGVSTISWMEIK
jgi:hypothetical protein